MIKFKRLQRRLKLPLWQAVGLLESLWQLTAKDTPRGDIGRFSDEDIAAWLEYDGDAGELIEAFVSSGWIDRSDEHRLIVHDWHDHAPNYVRGNVTRHTAGFVTNLPGDTPKDSEEEPPQGTVPPSLVKPSLVKSSQVKRESAPATTPTRPKRKRRKPKGRSINDVVDPLTPPEARAGEPFSNAGFSEGFSDPEPPPIPESLDTPEFRQTWERFLSLYFEVHGETSPFTKTEQDLLTLSRTAQEYGIARSIFDLELSIAKSRVGNLLDSTDDNGSPAKSKYPPGKSKYTI